MASETDLPRQSEREKSDETLRDSDLLLSIKRTLTGMLNE